MMDELIDFLTREDVKQFIKENVATDVNKLILNPPPLFRNQIKNIAAQILARQKAKGKLDSWVSNFDLIMPPPLSIEQASSETTCEYKKQLVSGSHLIDLTGGMGVDFLAMHKSFSKSTYVEQDSKICGAFRHNAKVLSSKAEIINEEASAFLAKFGTDKNATIYLDPARRDSNKTKVFKIEDCSPNLIELQPLLRKKAKKVLVKYSPMLDIHAIVNSVSNIKEIHIVSVKNETKELLILIDFEFIGNPKIHCINLESSYSTYVFEFENERITNIEFKSISQYILEPNSSIMKAGAFKKIANDFNIYKVAEHTHLYSTENPDKDFPGRVFKVVADVNKKTIKEFAKEGKINVITRNYPLSALELKKKWKLKDGGDFFLIAFRDKENKARMVITKRFDFSK